MRAVRVHHVGGPSVLQVDDVPEPGEPKGDEIVVQVAAASINGTDLGLRRGDLEVALLGRMPFTLGFDIAGTVVRCGPKVTAFAVGDRVMALLGHGGGGQADLVVLRQSRAARVPDSCALTEAAALPLAGLTALQALHGRAHLHARRSGSRVLVVGAAGGIGSYAVQLAKLSGAHVTAFATRSKLHRAAALGADELIGRDEGDVGDLGRQWDVVLDCPGSLTMSSTRRALSPDGVLVSTRPISRDALLGRSPFGSRPGQPRFTAVATRARSQDLAHLAALVASDRLLSPVDRVYPVAEATGAHLHAEGAATGKVVLELA